MSSPRLFLKLCACCVLIAGCSGPNQDGSAAPTLTLRPFLTATSTRTPTPLALRDSGTPQDLLPTPTPFVHQVQEGETLLDITLEYGITLDELLAANPGIDPRFLSIGQELRIPSGDESGSDSLLPTSTPLPLPVEAVLCERQPSELLLCLVTVTNPTETGVEGLTARITLIGADGAEIDSKLAYAPLNLLPPGSRLPLVATFGPEVSEPAAVSAAMFSAVQSTGIEERFVALELEIEERGPLDGGQRWRVRGRAELAGDEEPEAALRISILALGVDAQGQIVGFTKWEPGQDERPPWRFDLLLQSVRGPIERVEVLAEAAPLTE